MCPAVLFRFQLIANIVGSRVTVLFLFLNASHDSLILLIGNRNASRSDGAKGLGTWAYSTVYRKESKLR